MDPARIFKLDPLPILSTTTQGLSQGIAVSCAPVPRTKTPSATARSRELQLNRHRANNHWSVRTRDRAIISCELRDNGSAGVEVQLLRDGAWFYGRRWPNRKSAPVEVDDMKAEQLARGGILLLIAKTIGASVSTFPDPLHHCG